jgi:ketosteroid isomerase-like protein
MSALRRATRSPAVTGQPYRSHALGVIRVRDGQIVHYQDYMDPIATARLLGRTRDLADAITANP